MIRIRDIKIPVSYSESDMMDRIVKEMCLDKIYPGNSYPDFSYRILKRSIDARKKPEIYYVCTLVLLIGEAEEQKILDYYGRFAGKPGIKKILGKICTDPPEEYRIPECGKMALTVRPVVVGAGPAGLFAALILARSGFKPLVIERGQCVEERKKSVDRFWDEGVLSPDSNVQFGEGGAGTFSDGKLNTLTKDTGGRNSFVIKTFYEHGADADILIDAKPHIGTDILMNVVRNIREEIKSLGGSFLFNTRLDDIHYSNGELDCVEVTDVITGKRHTVDAKVCILCIGHSARDTFKILEAKNVSMEQKNFAVGFRVIHPQMRVDLWQYGQDSQDIGLPPADYKVTNETSGGRRVYSFCMCPGGYVVNSSSEDKRCCVNGMSEHDRDSGFANSAIIVAVGPDDFKQDEVAPDHPLAGMYYQQKLEEEAFIRGKGEIPVQLFDDFENNTGNENGKDGSRILSDAVRGHYREADLRGIFSDSIDEAVIESMHKFGYTRKDFDGKDVWMLGVESRTSSPVRIVRQESFESNIKGLYPCGEGAGYAGGITSAAADGIKCAEKIIDKYHMEAYHG